MKERKKEERKKERKNKEKRKREREKERNKETKKVGVKKKERMKEGAKKCVWKYCAIHISSIFLAGDLIIYQSTTVTICITLSKQETTRWHGHPNMQYRSS